MNSKTIPAFAWISGLVAISAVAAFAFSAADTGARSVSAGVVNDSDAFLALKANADSPYKDFVSEDADGKLSVSFDASGTATGQGINPESSYTFHTLIDIVNQGTGTADVSLALSGADSSLCEVAFTSTSSQSDADYSASPASIELATGSTAYLGLKMSASGKTTGQAVDCEITASASEVVAA